MRKIRKLLCVIMSVVLLFSCFAFQGYALFDFLKKDPDPEVVTVTSFELTDSNPISLRDVENQFEHDTRYIDKNDTEKLQEAYEKWGYDLGEGSINYGYKIKLSDGKEIESNFFYSDLSMDEHYFDDHTYVTVRSVVGFKECFEAVESGKSTVTVKYIVRVYTSDKDIYSESHEYHTLTDTFTMEKEREIIPSFVKNFEIISGVPETAIDGYMSAYDFREAVFSYELYDGRKGTEKVTTQKKNTFQYSLGGEYLYIYLDKESSQYIITLLDAEIVSNTEIIETPFERMKLSDYVLSESNELVSVRCTLFKKNSERYDFIVPMNGEYMEFFEGVPVRIYHEKANSGMYKNSQVIRVRAEAGPGVRDSLNIELALNCPCICHKGGIGQFLFKIANVFWKLFGINRECLECSATHY